MLLLLFFSVGMKAKHINKSLEALSFLFSRKQLYGAFLCVAISRDLMYSMLQNNLKRMYVCF